MTDQDEIRLFIGTFRRLGGAGIYSARFDSRRSTFHRVELAAAVVDPIYLALACEGDRLYSVGATDPESRDGLMIAFEVDQGTSELSELCRQSTGGAAACHIAVAEAPSVIAAANYLGGSIAAASMDESGKLLGEAQCVPHVGASIHPRRQAGPHPHSVNIDPYGRRVIACDLGTDQLLQYEIVNKRSSPLEVSPQIIRCEPGAGPRHLVFHPSGSFVYVVNELSSTVTGYGYSAAMGITGPFGTWSTLPSGWRGLSLPAAIRLSHGGERLYVSNRGHDSIATFLVNSVNGHIDLLGHTFVGANLPRDVALAPDGRTMFVANEQSGTVAALAIDSATGLPGEVSAQVEIPGAVSVVVAAR